MPELTKILHRLDHVLTAAATNRKRTAELWTQFSSAVLAERERQGRTRKEVCALAGQPKIGPGTLFYLEQGRRDWNLDRAHRIVGVLNTIPVKTVA